MTRKPGVLLLAALLFFSSCAMLQSVVKGTFPYTANMVVPASAKVGDLQTAISTGSSFDQDFTKDGNNASRLSEVRVVSAKLQSNDPSDYNIGSLSSVRIYMAKSDGSDEVMVAIRNDISPNIGNSLVLDIDNSHFLDALVRQQNVRIRMVYQLRKAVKTDVVLKVSLGIGAN